MTIRLALLALAVSLWSCGDDDDAPPAAPVETVLRPSGELMPWDLSAVVPIDSVRTLSPGTPLYMRTEFANGELADLEMLFVEVVDDFLQPMPVIMVESSDPVLIQLGGIAQGMSGSPIFSEQGTMGAIAYGYTAQDNPPFYFFATPIEWVIGSRGTLPPAAKPSATWNGARITPLEIPLVITGLNRPQLSGGGSFPFGEAVSAGLTQERQESFEAGRPLAVGLLLGEITGGGVGTISYVDGNRIYGFGHPFESLGPVELPIIEAKVLGEISNLSAPFKFATLNPRVRGVITEDRLPAVRGVLEEEPELVPIRSRYTFPSGSELELTHHMPTVGLDSYTTLSIATAASFRPLYNRVDNDPDHSIRVTTNISFAGSDSVLARTRLYAEPAGRLYSLIGTASGDLSFALTELMTRNDYLLQVSEAEVHVEMIPEPRFAQVVEVSADTVTSLGSTLPVSASLRVGRRADREIGLELAIPDTIPPGIYLLEVASGTNLIDDEGGGDFGFFGPPGFGGDGEKLEEVFARLNEPDENIVLKARLTFSAPPPPPEIPEPPPEADGSEGEPGSEGDDPGEAPGDVPDIGLGDLPFFGDFFPPEGPPPTVSTEQEVGLYIEGTQSLEIELTVPEE